MNNNIYQSYLLEKDVLQLPEIETKKMCTQMLYIHHDNNKEKVFLNNNDDNSSFLCYHYLMNKYKNKN